MLGKTDSLEKPEDVITEVRGNRSTWKPKDWERWPLAGMNMDKRAQGEKGKSPGGAHGKILLAN